MRTKTWTAKEGSSGNSTEIVKTADRRHGDLDIATVMAGIRNSHAKPSAQKEAVMAEDIIAMIQTLDRGSLRGLGDRSMLLIGFAGGLQLSEIVCLDQVGPDRRRPRLDRILDKGMLVTLRGKTGWREVEMGADRQTPRIRSPQWKRESSSPSLHTAPLFRHMTGQGKSVGTDRLNDKEVARLVKRAAMTAGVRGDLSEIECGFKVSGHSLRAGLASSAEVDERYVQKQLGPTSAKMTRRYQRQRDRFRVYMTKASGL